MGGAKSVTKTHTKTHKICSNIKFKVNQRRHLLCEMLRTTGKSKIC